jgi:hypothetical protein
MTYQNDPNRPSRRDLDETNYTPWMIGGFLALVLILGVFFMTSSPTGTSTATNTTPATTTTPAPGPTTTGQRSDPVQPANPAGNMPTAPGSAR